LQRSRRFFAIRFAAKGFLALLLFASCAAALRGQTIQFKVVNGKTGRPVAGVCVSVLTTHDNRIRVDILTDKDGVARLRLTHNDNEVYMSYNLKLGCGGDGVINPVLKYSDLLKPDTYLYPSCAFPQDVPNARWKEIGGFSTQEVLQHGVVSANTCGKVTASPQPGEVILFVRPRTFGEKVEDWRNSDEFPF